MAFPAEDGGKYANGGSYRQQENYYTQEDAVIVDKAKKTHRETTQSAQRALKVILQFPSNSLQEICDVQKLAFSMKCNYAAERNHRLLFELCLLRLGFWSLMLPLSVSHILCC